MTVSVIIPFFGDKEWKTRAELTAETLLLQNVKPDEIIVSEGETISQARNIGVKKATSEWIILLDADDLLASNYIEKSLECCKYADIIKPSTIGIYPDGTMDQEPSMIPERNLYMSNHIIIGAMFRREMFVEFEEYPILEDWDFWLRMFIKGARIIGCPEAVYIVNVRPDSRNSNVKLHNRVYSEIRKKVWKQL